MYKLPFTICLHSKQRLLSCTPIPESQLRKRFNKKQPMRLCFITANCHLSTLPAEYFIYGSSADGGHFRAAWQCERYKAIGIMITVSLSFVWCWWVSIESYLQIMKTIFLLFLNILQKKIKYSAIGDSSCYFYLL